LGRIADLQKELAQLNRRFTVRCKRAEVGGQVEIEFSNLERCAKFMLTFDVAYSYPCGPMACAIKPLFGEIREEDINKVLNRVPARFGRLTNICKAVQQL
jgi:uncharacterized membrane protein